MRADKSCAAGNESFHAIPMGAQTARPQVCSFPSRGRAVLAPVVAIFDGPVINDGDIMLICISFGEIFRGREFPSLCITAKCLILPRIVANGRHAIDIVEALCRRQLDPR